MVTSGWECSEVPSRSNSGSTLAQTERQLAAAAAAQTGPAGSEVLKWGNYQNKRITVFKAHKMKGSLHRYHSNNQGHAFEFTQQHTCQRRDGEKEG